ncbi:MAG TPA: STAS domain-containing protein, partial [Candidatus Nanopelagicales bacterium]|nr:STAS domain-containing protein [Candidatus Nanopelagicales bacterium]
DLVIVYLNEAWRRVAAQAGGGGGAEPGFAPGRVFRACADEFFGRGEDDAELLAAGLRGEKGERRARMGDAHGERWLRTRVLPFGDGASRRLLMGKQEITAEVAGERSLSRYHAILQAVGYAASQFLGRGAWADRIARVLGRLGEVTDVSRVYVFDARLTPDGEWISTQLHEWCAPGVKPEIDNPDLQDMSFGSIGFQRWVDELSSDRPVYGHVRDFPEGERAILEPQEIVSIVVVPIFVDGAWWGFVGFDECRSDRAWSEAEIDALRAAAGLFGAAISDERSRALTRERLMQEEIIRVQDEALRELEAPLIPVHEQVVVMPLVGTVDAGRLTRVMETLLAGLSERKAQVAILDVTGVRRVDAQVAEGLMRVARAARLLGAEVMLTGIGAEVARTLVELGADLGDIATSLHLQAGIARAMRRVRGG